MSTTDNAPWFGTEDHLSEEGIALYVDALHLGRTEGLPVTVLDHVHHCLECKQEITGLFALVAQEDVAHAGPHPYFDRAATQMSNRRTIYRLAAGLAAVVGLGALTYTLLLRAPETVISQQAGRIETQPDTATASSVRGFPSHPAPSPELLAARFTPSPELEDLVNGTTRSAETTVLAPANGATLRPGIRFSWSTTARPPYTLTILDNHRHTVRTLQGAAASVTVKDTLEAGVYYWTLSADGDLLHVGKFIVR